MSTRVFVSIAFASLLVGQVMLYNVTAPEGRGWVVLVMVLGDLVFLSAIVDKVRSDEQRGGDDQ